MKLTTILLAGAIVLVGAGYARAQDLQAEKTLVANERAINDAVEKGNVAAFTRYVAADGCQWTGRRAGCRWPTSSRASTR